ncbi:MAG: ATP-binding protein [Kiritimatiellae bacterium]|nr:ATP-binding protein [Kiritimatiellia bacterium]
MDMEKVATDIYTFEELRGGGFTYVDKTDALYTMASGDVGKLFFIARPRRFGKSLAVSTLKALFEGRRELFTGLAIEPKWDWSKKWPVLHLDMGSMQAANVSEFRELLSDHLLDRARELGVEGLSGSAPSVLFKRLIDALAAKSPDGHMVLLVDEYDKPLLGHLMKQDVTEFRDTLKAFYSVIKTLEAKQRFAFITGVSKFSKVSIFSDLNNLIDCTMDASAATLFGYTHDEVLKYFPGRIRNLAEANGLTEAEAFGKIVEWYDGYKFHHSAEPVVNPVSLGLCLQKSEFNDYWSATAVPTFLIDILKKQPLDFSTVDISESELNAYEPDNPRIVTLLYQTGYLTIRSFRQMGAARRYTLKFPNLEVENSFLENLVGAYVGQDSGKTSGYAVVAGEALYAHDMPKFLKALKAFFSDIPYDMTDRQNEQMWQTIVYVVLRSIGINVNGEVKTNDGRIDMVVDLPDDVYIVEFKLDRPATEALEQIKGKDYAGKYALSGKRITIIGISFSAAKRTIVEDLVEELQQ